jgi:4-hydroxyphenylpyruvate dioxygenase
VVRRADHPSVGLVLDSFHTLARKIDPDSIRSIPGDRIFLVQVADAPVLDMDLLSWSRHFRNMPGQGGLDVAGFLSAIQATGYGGFLSLEIFNDQFRAGSARQVAIDGRRSLLSVMDQVSRGAPDQSPSARPAEFPARAQPLSVEFIEFAVDEESGAELSRLFSGLGFARSGRHVSKDVEWWRQGSINLVINSEREGFAHASYITHGPSVCAIGLGVEDAEAAMNRARALLAQPFAQAVGPGELEVPAIRGLGGSLLYFTDPKSELARVWEVEFRGAAVAAEAAVAIGLHAIDHVSQSMQYDEMLSWLLFYTSIFAMERTPQLDIADPAGLVRSQVVQTADGAVRIALNGSQGNRTLSGRFLTEFFGSGVQHIAFASADIFASAERMRERGLRALAVPENYYDDLESRFDLSPETMDQLRENSVLYDRDDQGEFFQLYTETFADRFFFEIVQRRSNYRGFGAANAPIRLAAQARVSRHPALARR